MKQYRYHITAVLTLLLASALLITGCAASAQPSPTPAVSTAASASASAAPTDATSQKTFTAAELAKYDGLNGNPAYIAVDGKVYDVTNVPEWKGGSHAGGRFQAGKDYTSEINQAPHGKDKLNGVPIVGIYANNDSHS